MNKVDIKEVNLKVSDIIKDELSEVSFKTWFRQLEDAYMEESNIIIPVGNSFEKLLLEEKYLTILDNAYSQFIDTLNYDKVLIRINGDKEEDTKEITAKEARKLANEVNTETNVEKQISDKLETIYRIVKSYSKSGEYTFETIIDYGATHAITKGIIKSLERNGYKVSVKECSEDKTCLVIEW